jgi:hypothetical protein
MITGPAIAAPREDHADLSRRRVPRESSSFPLAVCPRESECKFQEASVCRFGDEKRHNILQKTASQNCGGKGLLAARCSCKVHSILRRHKIKIPMMPPLRGKARYSALAFLIKVAKGVLIAERREEDPSLSHRDPSAVSKRQYPDRLAQSILAAGIKLRWQLRLAAGDKSCFEPIPYSHGVLQRLGSFPKQNRKRRERLHPAARFDSRTRKAK